MIDEISSGVQRLNNMAHTIQDEIQQHDRLIDGVEVEVEVAQTKLEHNKRQIERYLQTNSLLRDTLLIVDWCQIKTILVLAVIAFVLILSVLL